MHFISNAQWQKTNGPMQCQVNCLIKHNGSLLAGTVQSIFKSTDDGLNWTDVNPDCSNLVQFQSMGANIFALTLGAGYYMSTDEGDTWTLRKSMITSEGVQECAIIGTKIYAASFGDGVLVSSDSGYTWTVINNGLTNHYVLTITACGSYLVAGTNTGIFVSADGGLTWNPSNSGLTNTAIKKVRSDGQYIYAGSEQGVFLSTDNAATWSPLTVGTAPIAVKALETSGSIVSMATQDYRVFISNDHGTNWADVTTVTNRNTINDFCISGNTIHLANNGGVFVTSDNGTTWNERNVGFYSNSFYALAASDSTVFALCHNTGLFSSADRGNNWQYSTVNNWLHPGFFSSTAHNGNDFYTCGVNGIWKSNNDGVSWTRVDSGLIAFVKCMAFMGSTFFIGTFNQGVFVSTDNGYSWIERNNGITEYHIPAFAAFGNAVLAGSQGDGIFRSTDNGLTWTPANTGLSNLTINCMLVDSEIVYAGTLDKLYVSGDHGFSWMETNLPGTGVTHMVKKNGVLFAKSPGHFFISTNNGFSWTDIFAGLPFASDAGIAVTATDIYVATFLDGVWRRALTDVISVEELTNQFSISFGPNPAIDILNISNTQFDNLEIHVHDMYGRKVISETVSKESSLDIHSLSAGIYSINVVSENKLFYIGKFIKV